MLESVFSLRILLESATRNAPNQPSEMRWRRYVHATNATFRQLSSKCVSFGGLYSRFLAITAAGRIVRMKALAAGLS